MRSMTSLYLPGSAALGGLSKRSDAAAGDGAAKGEATAGAATGAAGSAAVVPEYGGGGMNGDVGPAEGVDGATAAVLAPGVK